MQESRILSNLAKVVSSECVVQQFVFVNCPKEVPVKQCDVIGELLCAKNFNVHIDSISCSFLLTHWCLPNRKLHQNYFEFVLWLMRNCELTNASKCSFGATKMRPFRQSAVGTLTSWSLKTVRSPFDLISTSWRSSVARFNFSLSAAQALMTSAVVHIGNRSVQ